MKYVLLVDSAVAEVIPEFDPAFPGISVKDRYSSEFLSKCVNVPDSTETPANYIYNHDTGEFTAPPIPEITPGQPIVPGERFNSPQDDTDALTVDHEYRLTLLELGVSNDAV